ncbi:hypothetical protein M231_08040 [Tremella mesenterica]|uniref:F-box domain-containing protein n=1 Tax=Tremella mesenterica TaxID=5217 RepID=A0A4Q1B9S0_TREME|nr:hypothetical protein M231_08040 [Tremella mesenterica]
MSEESFEVFNSGEGESDSLFHVSNWDLPLKTNVEIFESRRRLKILSDLIPDQEDFSDPTSLTPIPHVSRLSPSDPNDPEDSAAFDPKNTSHPSNRFEQRSSQHHSVSSEDERSISTFTAPRLGPELLRRIISFCPPSTLSVLLRTNQSLFLLSSQHLYHTIDLRLPESHPNSGTYKRWTNQIIGWDLPSNSNLKLLLLSQTRILEFAALHPTHPKIEPHLTLSIFPKCHIVRLLAWTGFVGCDNRFCSLFEGCKAERVVLDTEDGDPDAIPYRTIHFPSHKLENVKVMVVLLRSPHRLPLALTRTRLQEFLGLCPNLERLDIGLVTVKDETWEMGHDAMRKRAGERAMGLGKFVGCLCVDSPGVEVRVVNADNVQAGLVSDVGGMKGMVEKEMKILQRGIKVNARVGQEQEERTKGEEGGDVPSVGGKGKERVVEPREPTFITMEDFLQEEGYDWAGVFQYASGRPMV